MSDISNSNPPERRKARHALRRANQRKDEPMESDRKVPGRIRTRRKAEPPNKIGYCNPPKHTQFKPGESGNSKGRPRGSKNLKTIIRDELKKKIVFRRDGREEKITTMEGIGKRVIHKALDGDPVSIKLIISMDNEFELSQIDDNTPTDQADDSDQTDQQLLDEFAEQIKETQELESSDDEESDDDQA